MAQLHEVEEALGFHRLLGPGRAAGGQAVGDVLGHRQVREQGVVLKDDADGAPARRQGVDDLIRDDHPPFGLAQEAGDDAQQRGLAAARRPEQRDQFAALDVEVHVFHGDGTAVPMGDAVEHDGPAFRLGLGAGSGWCHGEGSCGIDLAAPSVANRMPFPGKLMTDHDLTTGASHEHGAVAALRDRTRPALRRGPSLAGRRPGGGTNPRRRVEPHLNAIARENPRARQEAEASAARWRAGAPPLAPRRRADDREGVPRHRGAALDLCRAGRGRCLFPRRTARRAGTPGRPRDLAKTTMPEFAVQGYTASARFGVTRNPWNVALTPGGSTGGGAAATAAGYAPVALGTDGGGSLRRPAAHTGLVGLKSSLGRVPRHGGLPSPLLDFEVAGALTRTVADSRAMLPLMQGADPRVLWSNFAPNPGPRAPLARPLRRAHRRRAPRSRHRRLVPAGAGASRGAGRGGRGGPLPFEIAGLNALWPEIGKIGLARLFEADPALAARASAPYRAMAERARGPRRPCSPPSSSGSSPAQRRERRVCGDRPPRHPLRRGDAWAADAVYPEVIDGQPVGPRGHAVYSGWVNAAALPGLSLPVDPGTGRDADRPPPRGGFGRDDLLLDIAEALERRRPFADRWPVLPGTSEAAR